MDRFHAHRVAAIAAWLLTLAAAAPAQSGLTGKWQGETDGGASIVLNLTLKGDTLTGTVIRNGRSADLADGKVTKNSFTFKATVNDRAEAFSGELAGDQLKVWLDRQGPANAVVLTRVKSK